MGEINPQELTDYERGFIDALWTYAWWKDGVVYVGSTGTTYVEARDRFLAEQRKSLDVSPGHG